MPILCGFTFNNNQYYSKDKNHVYYNTKRLPGADAATFGPLLNDDTNNYWHDKNNVYYAWWKKVEGADGSAFVYAGNGYGYDKNHVFFQHLLVKEADPATFTVMFNNTGRDANHIFVREKCADTVKDVKTFEMVFIKEEQFGKDSEQIYVLRYTPPHPLLPFPGADPETFDVVGDYYAKDKNKVYYYSYHADQIRVLENAAPSTFMLYSDPVRGTDATDGIRHYKAGVLHVSKE